MSAPKEQLPQVDLQETFQRPQQETSLESRIASLDALAAKVAKIVKNYPVELTRGSDILAAGAFAFDLKYVLVASCGTFYSRSGQAKGEINLTLERRGILLLQQLRVAINDAKIEGLEAQISGEDDLKTERTLTVTLDLEPWISDYSGHLQALISTMLTTSSQLE